MSYCKRLNVFYERIQRSALHKYQSFIHKTIITNLLELIIK